MKKTVDYIDLCRYDKELRYAVDVVVLSDKFILGDKGDRLRFSLSEYGYNRLLMDCIDGLINIMPSTLMIDAFDFPEVDADTVRDNLTKKLKRNIARWDKKYDEAEKGDANE